jgi:hypothetical protein
VPPSAACQTITYPVPSRFMATRGAPETGAAIVTSGESSWMIAAPATPIIKQVIAHQTASLAPNRLRRVPNEVVFATHRPTVATAIASSFRNTDWLSFMVKRILVFSRASGSGRRPPHLKIDSRLADLDEAETIV